MALKMGGERRFWNEHKTGEAEYVLKRHATKAGKFTVERPFIYVDRIHGDIKVPPSDGDGAASFETDLASVPLVASWLVPKDGTHTPAALVHDALIGAPGEPPAYEADAEISRHDADRIFLEAMAHLEVPLLRRWMMWAAVTMATLVTPGRRWYWYWRLVLAVDVLGLVVVGLVSVLDLVDIHEVRVPVLGWRASTSLPWMGDQSAGAEIGGGLAAVVAFAVVTPWLWLRWWRAGLVASLVLIPFAFPLLVSSLAYGAYFLVELIAFKLHQRTYDAGSEASPPAAPRLIQRMSESTGRTSRESDGIALSTRRGPTRRR